MKYATEKEKELICQSAIFCNLRLGTEAAFSQNVRDVAALRVSPCHTTDRSVFIYISGQKSVNFMLLQRRRVHGSWIKRDFNKRQTVTKKSYRDIRNNGDIHPKDRQKLFLGNQMVTSGNTGTWTFICHSSS